MKVTITSQDILQAYQAHSKGWHLRQTETPLAIALKREYGFAQVKETYNSILIYKTKDGPALTAINHSCETEDYRMQFSQSIFSSESHENYQARKELHKTSSDHGTPARRYKEVPVVKPVTFILNVDDSSPEEPSQ